MIRAISDQALQDGRQVAHAPVGVVDLVEFTARQFFQCPRVGFDLAGGDLGL
jgi:hypothetical protein